MIFTTVMSMHSPHSWAFKKKSWEDQDIYPRFLRCLLLSIKKFHPKSRVYMTAINLSQKDRDWCHKLNKNIDFRARDEDFSNRSQEYYKGYLMKQRTRLVRDVLFSDNVIYLDVDCMLRAPLKVIEDSFVDGVFDFAVLHRPNDPPKTRFNAGVLVFAPTYEALTLVETWLNMMPDLEKICEKTSQGRSTAGDQERLWRAYERVQPKTLFLSKEYNDGFLGKESVIWHGCKGDKKNVVDKFEAEVL